MRRPPVGAGLVSFLPKLYTSSMEWITVLFSWVWFDAALLVLAVAVCAVLFASRRVPRVRSGPPLQEISTPLLQEMGDELHVLGFRYHENLEYERKKGKGVVLTAYLSTDQLELAYVAAPQRKNGPPIVELLSVFEPFGSVLSTNGARGCALSERGPPTPDKIVVRAPWKGHIEELIELHRELCATAEECGLFRVPLPNQAIGVVMQEELVRDYDLQVSRGTMKRSGVRRYRLTIKGILLLIPRAWATRIRDRLFGGRRCSDRQQRERVESEVRDCLELPTSVRNRWPKRLWTYSQVS